VTKFDTFHLKAYNRLPVAYCYNIST